MAYVCVCMCECVCVCMCMCESACMHLLCPRMIRFLVVWHGVHPIPFVHRVEDHLRRSHALEGEGRALGINAQPGKQRCGSHLLLPHTPRVAIWHLGLGKGGPANGRHHVRRQMPESPSSNCCCLRYGRSDGGNVGPWVWVGMCVCV